jgi:hypothetical protein
MLLHAYSRTAVLIGIMLDVMSVVDRGEAARPDVP